MIDLNLISTHRRRARRLQRRLRHWGMIVTGAASIGVLGSVAANLVMTPPPTLAKDAMRRIQDEIDRDLATIEANLDETAILEREIRVGREVRETPDWSILLALFADARPAEVAVEHVSIRPAETPGAWNIQVKGLGTDQRAILLFVSRLENSGLFERIDHETAARAFANANAYSYTLTTVMEPRR